MPHAWLLAGPQGVGKRRFADAAVRHILASAAGPPVDEDILEVSDQHPTARLIAAGSHMDLRVLESEVRERTRDPGDGIRRKTVAWGQGVAVRVNLGGRGKLK